MISFLKATSGARILGFKALVARLKLSIWLRSETLLLASSTFWRASWVLLERIFFIEPNALNVVFEQHES